MSLFRFFILELHLSFESVPHCAATKFNFFQQSTVYTFSRSSVHWQLDLSPLGHWSWQGLTPESAWNGQLLRVCRLLQPMEHVKKWTAPIHFAFAIERRNHFIQKNLQVWCSGTSTQLTDLTVHAECGAVAPHIEARCLRQSHLARPHSHHPSGHRTVSIPLASH